MPIPAVPSQAPVSNQVGIQNIFGGPYMLVLHEY